MGHHSMNSINTLDSRVSIEMVSLASCRSRHCFPESIVKHVQPRENIMQLQQLVEEEVKYAGFPVDAAT